MNTADIDLDTSYDEFNYWKNGSSRYTLDMFTEDASSEYLPSLDEAIREEEGHSECSCEKTEGLLEGLYTEMKYHKKSLKKTEVLRHKLEDDIGNINTRLLKKQTKLLKINHAVGQIEAGLTGLRTNFNGEVKRRKNLLMNKKEAATEKLQTIVSEIRCLNLKEVDLKTQYEKMRENIRKLVNERQELAVIIECKREELLQSELSISGNTFLDNRNDLLEFLEKDSEDYPEPSSPSKEDHVNSLAALKVFVKLLRRKKHHFKTVPKGPLFTFVSITNMRWAPLIEELISDELFTFLVENEEDEQLFVHLIEKAYGKEITFCQDPVRRPKVLNKQTIRRQTKPMKTIPVECDGESVVNMLDVLEVGDEDLFAIIAILKEGYKTFFFESEHKAFLAMSNYTASSKHEPIIGYTTDGFEVFPFPCFKTSKLKSLRKRAIYLRPATNRELIFQHQAIQEELTILQNKIEKRNVCLKTVRDKQLEVATEIKTASKDVTTLQQEEETLMKTIDAIENHFSRYITIENETERLFNSKKQKGDFERLICNFLEEIKTKTFELSLLDSKYCREKEIFQNKKSEYLKLCHDSNLKQQPIENVVNINLQYEDGVDSDTQTETSEVIQHVRQNNNALASQSVDTTIKAIIYNDEDVP